MRKRETGRQGERERERERRDRQRVCVCVCACVCVLACVFICVQVCTPVHVWASLRAHTRTHGPLQQIHVHLDVDDTLGVIYIHERNRAHTGAEGAGGGGAFDFTSHSAYSMHNQGSQAGTLSACSKGSKDGTHAGGGAAKERWGGRGGSRASEGAWVTTSSVPLPSFIHTYIHTYTYRDRQIHSFIHTHIETDTYIHSYVHI